MQQFACLRWDLYLSSELYSGKSPIAAMRISQSLRDQLPAKAKETNFKSNRGELILPLFEWSLADLNVPPYLEVRVYREVARQLCAIDTDPQASALIVRGRPALIDGSYKVTSITCSELVSH
jgi:hypothetical protein